MKRQLMNCAATASISKPILKLTVQGDNESTTSKEGLKVSFSTPNFTDLKNNNNNNKNETISDLMNVTQSTDLMNATKSADLMKNSASIIESNNNITKSKDNKNNKKIDNFMTPVKRYFFQIIFFK